MTLVIRNEDEKPYLHVLRYLFEQGDEEEIKKYILEFSENDPDYDLFIDKLKEFARNDNIEVIEEMIFDEDLINYTKEPEEFNEEEYEQFLYSGERYDNDPLEEIPDSEKDDDIIDDIVDKIDKEVGNGDLGDLDLLK